MKKTIIGMLGLLLLFSACHKEESIYEKKNTDELVSPALTMRMFENFELKSFSGIVEVYPCQAGTSVYYGNYVNGALSVFNGQYTVVNGLVAGLYNRELMLPVGEYNMVYWGTPKYDTPIFEAPAINHPGLTRDMDLSKKFFSLHKNMGDTTYMPTYDLVYGVKEAVVGTEDLQVALDRVVAGVSLIVKKKDGTPFSGSVASVKAQIVGIAERLNFYTAEPENTTKTVQFDLTASEDRRTMSNPTVMVFPSSPHPLLKLLVTLKDGSVYQVSQPLQSPLTANTHLTLNIVIEKIFADEDSGNFTINDWNETSETVDFSVIGRKV